ncbi:MAG: ATP-binding protein, partial [Gammaproteobacteria bacterium]
ANQQSALGSRGKTQLRAETPTGYLIATPGPHASDNLVQEIQLALDFLTTLSKFRDQERQLKTQNHLESIYETGARITHDVKNLLQSLNTLTTAVEHSKPEQAEAIQQLIRKQLPLVRQKLQTTLEKLDAPEDISSTFQVARIWWEKLRLRYEPNQIEFISRLETETLIPRDLFERVAENLLENAQRKRQTEPDISISIELIVTQQRITLCVTDSGSPAPEEIAQLLFKGPIDSTSGYGIALYQCAMQAVKQGFQLALSSNERGRVGFSLTGEIS